MKIQNAVVSNILDQSQRYFAHVTTVTLSWRVQNIVVMGRVYFTLECFEFSSNFEFDRNMLSGTGAWCSKWRMVVNTEKMQVVHFRPPRKPITQHELHFGEDTLHVVSEYKYIGVYLDGHMLLNSTAICLSGAASHALEAIRYRLKFLKE